MVYIQYLQKYTFLLRRRSKIIVSRVQIRCVTHLKRNIYAKVRHGDKAAIAADLRDIFRTGQRDYTVEMAWNKWQDMCNRWGKDYRSI